MCQLAPGLCQLQQNLLTAMGGRQGFSTLPHLFQEQLPSWSKAGTTHRPPPSPLPRQPARSASCAAPPASAVPSAVGSPAPAPAPGDMAQDMHTLARSWVKHSPFTPIMPPISSPKTTEVHPLTASMMSGPGEKMKLRWALLVQEGEKHNDLCGHPRQGNSPELPDARQRWVLWVAHRGQGWPWAALSWWE